MSDRRVEHELRDDALAALLGPWLPARRWFPVKGTAARIEAVGGTTLVDPEHEAEVRVLLVRAHAAGTGAVLQVPLVLLPPAADGGAEPTDPADPAWVGALPDGTRVLDGAGHRAFVRAWLIAADLPEPADGSDHAAGSGGAGAAAAGHLGEPRVLPGEQSNTSVILPGAGPDGSTAMLKVFRGLSDGDNPDVDVPRALAGTGWTHVPRPLAWMSATWPEEEPGDGSDEAAVLGHRPPAHGHLGVLSAFVPGAADGFELACEMASRDESFADLARDLGAVIGQMHRALVTALPVDGGASLSDDVPAPGGAPRVPVAAGSPGAPGPAPAADPLRPSHDDASPGVLGGGSGSGARSGGTVEVTAPASSAPASGVPVVGRHAATVSRSADADAVAHALAARFAWASTAVPALVPYADAVAALAERTGELRDLPPRQRVHGDLHLGQVLRGDDTWYVLDFEGEPLVPVSQRTRPDLALRDAAGMLRSFDYAAAVGGAPDTWTQAARTAFLEGYAAQSPPLDPTLRTHLLRVLELDKALYEAVYEARNRPGWTAIPLGAVARLLA
ncbi:MAG TPA: hypothetical protein VGC57_02120 [Cellulomonas sp.]